MLKIRQTVHGKCQSQKLNLNPKASQLMKSLINQLAQTIVHNQVATEIVTSNSFDLLSAQIDSGVIEINDENTPSECVSFNQQNSSNERDSIHGEDRSTQTAVKKGNTNSLQNRKRPLVPPLTPKGELSRKIQES
jgi:hypothetical protein